MKKIELGFSVTYQLSLNQDYMAKSNNQDQILNISVTEGRKIMAVFKIKQNSERTRLMQTSKQTQRGNENAETKLVLSTSENQETWTWVSEVSLYSILLGRESALVCELT